MGRFRNKAFSKKQFLSVLFLLFVMVNGYSQHSIITTNTITDITRIKKVDNVVVINGRNNFFAKCYDNCDQLITLQPAGPFNYNNNYVNVIDTNTFYVSSFVASNPYHAIVSKTNDGGQTWIPVLDTLSMEFFTVGLFVFDTNNIALCSTQGRTFVTNNGGDNWETGPQNGMPIVSGSFRINDSTAIIGVQERLRITTDKGSSWIGGSFLQANPSSFYAVTIDSIYMVSSGMAGTYFNYIFDQPFSSIDKNIPMMDPIGLYVVSKDEIYVTGIGWPEGIGRIMKTADLGNTWSYYNVPETERLLEMVFLNDSMALIGGYNGALVKWNKNSPMTEWGLGIAENSNGSISATAYPNPATHEQELEINTSPGERIEIQLYDLQGRNCGLIHLGVTDSEKQSISVDLSHLDAGIYVYQLRVGDKTGQLRFVKQ